MRQSHRAHWTLLLLLPLLFGGSPTQSPYNHILLVTVDTLRADHLGSYGSTKGLTPRLDQFAKESLVFETAIAPSSFTLASVAAIHTSRHPEEIRILNNQSKLPEGLPSAAQILRKRGFRTGAVVSNFVLRANASGIEKGFEFFDDELPEYEINRPDYRERTARITTATALRAFKNLAREPGSRVFLWVHYQDPHGPYTPPGNFRDPHLAMERGASDGTRKLVVSTEDDGLGKIPFYQYLKGHQDVGYYRAGYDGEVAFVDREIGRLFDGLSAQGAFPKTAVVFTADHGESLGENDYWFAHGEYLTEHLVRAPLMIRVPGRKPERRTDAAGLIDLMPTLAALGGASAPKAALGRDLLASDARAANSTLHLSSLLASHVPRFGLIEDGYLYIASLHGQELEEQIFRLGEPEKNLRAKNEALAARMRERLSDLRGGMQKGMEERKQALDAGDRAKLRALGYVFD